MSRVLVLDIFLDKGNLFGQFSLWPITYWRTSTGREVDFILGDKDLALEIKGSARIHEGDITALQTLLEDGPVKKCCLGCLEKQPRRTPNGPDHGARVFFYLASHPFTTPIGRRRATFLEIPAPWTTSTTWATSL